LAEGRDVQRRVEEDTLAAAVPAEDLAGAEVAVDVRPRRQRAAAPAVDVAAGDGAPTEGVPVVEDREDVVLRRGTERGVVVLAGEALEDAPAVVAAAHDRGVDLLARPLPDVPHPLLVRYPVEAEAPRVPEPVGEDLVESRGRAVERIRRG